MAKILFGTAGVPWSCQGTIFSGLKRLKELKLDTMEMSFTHGVQMQESTAKKVKGLAEKLSLPLSVHAPYYINFNSQKKEVLTKSKIWLLRAAKTGFAAGATSIVFHPGFYHAKPSAEVRKKIAEALSAISRELNENKVKVSLAPETTGRHSQFGSLEELLQLCLGVEGLKPTVDFAHLQARCKGCLKKKADFRSQLEAIEKASPDFFQDLHLHVSGINYAEKGERNHLNLQESDFNFKALLEALKEFKVKGRVICESPNLEEDALLLKNTFLSL